MSEIGSVTSEPIPVVALVYDELCIFEYGIVAEVFGLSRPELGRELYNFSSVALEKEPLSTMGGLTLKTTGTLCDLETAHTIVIPGWRGKNEPVPECICEYIRKAHRLGKRLVSICSGGYVLAAAGLLENRRATTHWQYAKDFQSKYPGTLVQDKYLYVDDSNIITSAGSSAGIDTCLYIVRCDYGAKIANMVARRLVMHSHRQGSQTQFIEQPVPKFGRDQHLSHLVNHVRANLTASYSISSMAKFACMSQRTFQRRFFAYTGIPVMKWLIQERISKACELLETTDNSIDGISQLVGFSTTETMRHHFRQQIELSPNEYRKRFKGQNSHSQIKP